MTNGAATPPGWYDDTSGRQRWWDGQSWGPYLDEAYPQAAGQYAAPAAKPRSSKLPWILGIGAAVLVLVVGVAVVGVAAFVASRGASNTMQQAYDKYIDSYKTSDCTEYESVTTSGFRDDEWDGYYNCADFRENTGSNAWFDPATFTYTIDKASSSGDQGTLKVEEKYEDAATGDQYDDQVTYSLVIEGSRWRIDRMRLDN
jgi:hypothetical protein